MPERLVMVKDLTIPHLKRMGGPEYLGEEADFVIEMMYRVGKGRGFAEEQIERMTLEEVFGKPGEAREE
jgi:hypothetical protein